MLFENYIEMNLLSLDIGSTLGRHTRCDSCSHDSALGHLLRKKIYYCGTAHYTACALPLASSSSHAVEPRSVIAPRASPRTLNLIPGQGGGDRYKYKSERLPPKMNIIVSSPRETNYFRVDDPVPPHRHRQLSQRQLANRFLNEPYPSLYTAYSAMPPSGKDRERSPSTFSRRPVAKRKLKLLLTYGLDW